MKFKTMKSLGSTLQTYSLGLEEIAKQKFTLERARTASINFNLSQKGFKLKMIKAVELEMLDFFDIEEESSNSSVINFDDL